MADYKDLASNIIENVGGASNVDKVIHCITRLRFYLKDEKKANDAAFEDMAGVAGSLYNKGLGQYQVVIGPAVADVYDEVIAQLGDRVVDTEATEAATAETEGDNGSNKPTNIFGWIAYGFKVLIGTITGSMIPVIGLLAAGGMLNGFLTILSDPKLLGWVSPTSTTFTLVQSMAMAPFYFLPVLVGFTAAQHMKSDPLTVAAIGALLIKPEVVAIATGKATAHFLGMPINASFFGLPITVPNYAYTIFPIIFAAWLARPVGNFFKKHLPVAIRSIFQPLFTIFIVGSVVLVIMGPVITLLSSGISVAVNALINWNYALSGLIIGGLYQCLVIFGLHWMVVPLIANEIAQQGQSPLNALVNFTMIAQGAGALAVFFKTKNANLKGLAGAGTLSAFAGITEPAMYGINLKYGKVFWTANIGGAVGGLIAGLFHLHMYGFTGSLVGFPSFASSKDNPHNLLIFVIASIATILVGFLCTYFFGFSDKDLDKKTKTVAKKNVFKEAVQ
ncbi:PTS transporter subunit EIIC [Periweissella ghanensis]|uniref:PTS system beta-glucoside-specific EIIBCA component n=1 Tax=Periweissella ghanensis TaxID=467997 RepID=A0ABM8ZCV7_9LACO|nr:PTS transporter subunit EIIC [Periweissella ghanensis]MCM0600238.1 PTS transporter subunit EIIC [Periweissella ghanensis]CAH0419130.1 PTS system beta-glucoside-specific EIIBCA component [Periweissella ghanensis]